MSTDDTLISIPVPSGAIITNLRCPTCGASFSAMESDVRFDPDGRYVTSPCHNIDVYLDKEIPKTIPTTTNPKDIFGDKKAPLHLIPSSPLARLAMVMKLGAKKYGPYNWREKDVRLTVYLAAAERHLRAILDGESIDPESMMPHAAHVMACMAIIIDANDIGKLVDDRPLPGNFATVLRELEQ